MFLFFASFWTCDKLIFNMESEMEDLEYMMNHTNDLLFVLQYSFTKGLITCPKCCNCEEMKLIQDDSRIDGCFFRCSNCKLSYSIRSGSVFQNSKLEMGVILRIFYFWVKNFSVKETAKFTHVSVHTVSNFYGRFQYACRLDDLNQEPIGGNGKFVEINETCMSRRKYHNGRALPGSQVWVFEGITRTTGEHFAYVVPNRQAHTLVPLIQQNIQPGTQINSDTWGAYKKLNHLGGVSPYTHKEVNHHKNYLNPEDKSIHTQNIERMWKEMKEKKMKMNGVKCELTEFYVSEWNWKRRNGLSFEAAVSLMSKTNWNSY